MKIKCNRKRKRISILQFNNNKKKCAQREMDQEQDLINWLTFRQAIKAKVTKNKEPHRWGGGGGGGDDYQDGYEGDDDQMKSL